MASETVPKSYSRAVTTASIGGQPGGSSSSGRVMESNVTVTGSTPKAIALGGVAVSRERVVRPAACAAHSASAFTRSVA